MIKTMLAQLMIVAGIGAGVYVYGEQSEARAVHDCKQQVMHRPEFSEMTETDIETACRVYITSR